MQRMPLRSKITRKSGWRPSSLASRPPGAEVDPELPWTSDDDSALGALLGRFAESAEDGVPGGPDESAAVAWAQVAGVLLRSARTAGAGAITTGRWLSDQLIAAAPHLPVRDAATLQGHHGGRTGEELADALVRNAVRATAGVGMAGGALSAVKWIAPVTLVTVPLQLAIESLAVAAIEIKLVGELHEVYGVPVRGTSTQRGLAYASAWANRRGVSSLDPTVIPAGLGLVARQRVQRRLLVTVGRNIGTIAPMMLGAVYGGFVNQRTTRGLSDALRIDLRRGRPLTGGLGGRMVHGVLSAGSGPAGSVRSH